MHNLKCIMDDAFTELIRHKLEAYLKTLFYAILSPAINYGDTGMDQRLSALVP